MRIDATLVFKSIVKVQIFWKKMRRVLRSYRRRKYIVTELVSLILVLVLYKLSLHSAIHNRAI